MPRVPLPQQSPGPAGGGEFRPGPRIVPPRSFRAAQVGQLADATAGLGREISQVAQQQQDEYDNAKVLRANNALQERLQRLLYDPESGYLHTVGAGAAEHRQRILGQMEDAARSVAEEHLDNDLQRQAFQDPMQRRMLAAQGYVDRHAAQQTRVFEAGERSVARQGHVQDAINARVDSPDDGQAFQMFVRSAKAEAHAQADTLDWPQDSKQREALVRGTASDIHVGVINGLVEQGRHTEAREYLQGVDRAELDPETRVKLQGLVRRATVQDEGARLAVKIRDQIGREHRKLLADPNRTERLPARPDAEAFQRRGVSIIQGQYEAGKISLELRDSATAELERLAKIQRHEEVAAEKGVLEEAEQWLIKHKWASVDSLPAILHQQAEDLRLLDDLNDFARSGRRYSTDKEWLLTLYTAAGQQVMREMSLEDFTHIARRRTDPNDFQSALRLYANAQPEPLKVTETMGPEDHVREAARRIHIDPKRHPERYYLFHLNAQKRWQDFEASVGRKATQAEIAREVSAAAMDVVYDPGFITSTEVVLATRTPEELEALLERAFVEVGPKAIYLRQVPPLDRAQITEALRSMGIPVTQREIARQWLIRERLRDVRESEGR